jgi:hypothetical protein
MFSLTPAGDSIYVVGGQIFGSCIKTISRFIVTREVWTTLELNLEIGITNPGTVSIGNEQIFIFGG